MSAPEDVPAPRSQAPARLVLLVGAPRSGTTWLQGLLGAHPAIASPQETDLFRSYLEPLVHRWEQQLRDAADEQSQRRRKGLPLVLTSAEFDAAAGEMVWAMMRAAQRMKPSAMVVLEKSPAHSLSIPVARRYVADTAVIHLIRDGRDVASSMLAASEDWGRLWAPSSVAAAARVWQRYVSAARRDGPAGPYLELRYEDLRGEAGPAALQQAFALCGVDLGADEAAALLEEHSFANMSTRRTVAEGILVGGEAAAAPGAGEKARTEPAGFYRRGAVGSWREEWSRRDRQTFWAVAGDLLRTLGYEADDRWVGGPVRPPLWVRAGHRAANGSARSLRALAERIEASPRKDRRDSPRR